MEDPPLSRCKKPKLKLVCSFNGNFQPRPPSGELRYTGGESRIISVDRNIGFSKLKLMVLELIRCPNKFQHSFSLVYRLQDSESADGYAPALVVSDDDVRCMVDQYEKLEFYGKHCRLWIFVCNDDMYVQFGKIINGFMNFGESESLNCCRVGVLCNKNGFDGDKNKTFLKNETLSVNEKSLVKLCGCHFGGEKVGKMVTIVDKVKSSENSLRKIVLKQQLLAKQSGRVWSSHRGLGLCIEQGAMERANCDNEKNGQSLTDLSSEPDSSLGFNSTNPSFVGSSFRDSILDYKYNITNFVESGNFVPFLVSHSHPLNSKDGNPHVALNSGKNSLSGQSNLNLGNHATCNSSWSIGMLLFHEPSLMVSCYDDKCESRRVELASLSNTDSENIIPGGGDSKTLRAGLVPCSCSNQLDKSINPAKSSYGSSHGGIRNYRFGLNDARNQRNCRYLFRNHRNNLNEMGSRRNTKLDGRPWMGKFYPGLRSSSSISKQGQVMRSCYPTLFKPWSDSFNQQVLGEPRTLEYVLNNEQDKVTDQQDFAKIINYPNQTASPTLDGSMASSMNFSLHNLSLSSLNDEEQPTPFGSSSYISEAFLKPQSKAFDLMNEEQLSSAPQVQNPSGGPSISSSDKAVKLQKDNDEKSEPQHELEFTSSIDEKEEIKRTHEGSKVNGRIPTELAAVYNHLATKELQTIEHSDLEYIKELGSGTYGTVFHGKWKGSDVAIKKLKPSCFSGCSVEEDRLVADFWKEAQILGQLHHPNIVALYGVVTAGPVTNLATVTEYMVNGSLRQVLRRKDRTIDRRKRLIVAMDSAFGMEYLHEKNIVHFDLKSYNFLVNMRDPQRPVCKIGDLGLSKIKQKTLVSGGVRGTIPWMAPEILNGKNMVTEKVDVYSFGIVMWELLTCEEPYTNMRSHEIIAGIIKGTLRPEIPSWCDPAWRSLMERCWSSEPDARPAFSEIARELRAMAAAMNIK